MKKTKKGLALGLALLMTLSICSAALATPEQKTVEGQGDYFVTGESYPTAIQMAGYNSRDKILYTNFDLETTKTVEVEETAEFKYFIEVFNNNGEVLGTAGSFAEPEAKSGNAGENTATVTNKEVVLAPDDLTAGYRSVITVKEVDIE